MKQNQIILAEFFAIFLRLSTQVPQPVHCKWHQHLLPPHLETQITHYSTQSCQPQHSLPIPYLQPSLTDMRMRCEIRAAANVRNPVFRAMTPCSLIDTSVSPFRTTWCLISEDRHLIHSDPYLSFIGPFFTKDIFVFLAV
jgi:hypothetical protein